MIIRSINNRRSRTDGVETVGGVGGIGIVGGVETVAVGSETVAICGYYGLNVDNSPNLSE